MKKFILILFILISTNIFSIEFRTIIFTDYYGLIEQNKDYETLRQRTYINPEFYSYFGDITSLKISLEYYYDYFNEDQIPDISNIIKELYLTFSFSWGELVLGQKLTNKGKADVFSPLNIFNSSYRELYSLDESYQNKRSDLGLDLSYYIDDDSSLNLIYVPFPRPDYQGSSVIDIPSINYTLDKSSDPYLTDKMHSFFLTYNKYAYSLDMQFVYGNYIDGNYNYLIDNDNLSISKSYNRVQTLGLGISTDIGPFSIVEELAFNYTEDFEGSDIGIKNSDITLNSQFTKTLWGRTYGQLNVIYQYIFNFDNSNDDLNIAIQDIQLQPTDNILFFIAHLHDNFLRDKLYLALNLGYFFSPSIYIAPRVKYRITDNILIESGIDMYTGEYEQKLLEDDLGGDNFFIRVKYEY